MTEDKRIEWCKEHCISAKGVSYIQNLNFNDLHFIEINTNIYNRLNLIFNGEKLPDFINFKVKEISVFTANIDITQCPHLKSWKGLPSEKIGYVWLGSELENIESIPICHSIDHILIKDKQERHRTNKRLRMKKWQNFKSEVLTKLQEQNPEINISDYEDGIEWLAIHDEDLYKKFLEEEIVFTDQEIILNSWSVFESIKNAPPIKIKTNCNSLPHLHIDDDFNYSEGEKIMNNILGNKKIYLQEKVFSEEDFLKLVEEKTNHNIIESKIVNKKPPKNK